MLVSFYLDTKTLTDEREGVLGDVVEDMALLIKCERWKKVGDVR